MFRIANRIIRLNLSLILVAAGAMIASPSAQASDISYVNMFRNISYQQTGNGNTLTLNGTFLSLDLIANTPNAYTSASVMLPGGSSIPLSKNSSTDYGFQTSLLSKSNMDTMYPTGTYTFFGVGAMTDTTTLSYTADDYSKTVPYLTGSDYSNLQGLNASQSFTFHLSPYTPGGSQTDAFEFLTIFDQSTGNVVFTNGFLPSSNSSIFLPGGTLTAGKGYEYEIDYSDRDIAASTPAGADFAPQIGFDVRTDGAFRTAAAPTPEPSSLVLLGTGLLAGIGAIRRRLS